MSSTEHDGDYTEKYHIYIFPYYQESLKPEPKGIMRLVPSKPEGRLITMKQIKDIKAKE